MEDTRSVPHRDTHMEECLKAWVRHFLKQKQATADQTDGSIFQRAINHICPSVFYFNMANRLMPLAKAAILEAEEQGTDLPSGCLWVAEELTEAKGRMTRHWWSPRGGIYMCLVIYPVLLQKNWAHYNLAVGVGIANALRQMGVSASVKWINDVLCNGRKLAGVLTETVRSNNGSYLLFGIGINVNQRMFPESLPFATSLLMETGKTWDIASLIGAVVAEICWFFAKIEEWEAENLVEDPVIAGYNNPILLNWKALTDTLGRHCIYGQDISFPELEGTAIDIAHDGSLVLKTEDQQTVNIFTGEIRYV